LRNADLRETCLPNANLSNADFSGASLFNAILWNTNFEIKKLEEVVDTLPKVINKIETLSKNLYKAPELLFSSQGLWSYGCE